MRVSDMFAHSLGNLTRQKLRTLLTVFGVIVGTAAITLMVSLGIGLQAQTTEFFNRVDFLTSVQVFPQKRSTSFMSFGRPVPGGTNMKLDDAAIAEFKKIPGVLTAYPALDFGSPLTVERTVDGKKKATTGRFVQFIGIPQAAILPMYRDKTLAGSFWTEENPEERLAVVPADVLHDMGIGPPLPGRQKEGETPALKGDPRWNELLGMEIKLQFNVAVQKGDPPPKDDEKKEDEKPKDEDPEMVTKTVTRRFRIAAIYDSADIGLPMAPSVFIPLEQGKEILKLRASRMQNPDSSYRSITVKVKDASMTDTVQRDIEGRGYGTMTIQDVVQVIGYVFVTLKAVLGAVASIGLIVAFFGIANTMIMAILERTREIGVMKALGARNAEIRRLFVMEAAAIGGVGALFGIGGGWAFGKALNLIVAWFVEKRGGPEGVYLFVVSPWLAGGTLAFAVVVAVIAGLYPAWRASRLDPVAALRSL